MYPPLEGYYPHIQLIGATFARDFQALNLKCLGGVAPTFRFETVFYFDKTYKEDVNAGFQDKYVKRDELRWAASADIKVRIPWLNPRYYFNIGPQFAWQKILKYPHPDWNAIPESNPRRLYGMGLVTGDNYLEDDNYVFACKIFTGYFHYKLVPDIFWMHDFANHADMWRFTLTYDRTHNWHYTIGCILLNGKEYGGFNIMENKDYAFFKVSYRWG